ncbi:MAG: hypothetical protein VX228_16755, partial [Pseudomonadota bacterium]|nr:hypothetical protein [Pseudomonadota bacterium]
KGRRGLRTIFTIFENFMKIHQRNRKLSKKSRGRREHFMDSRVAAYAQAAEAQYAKETRDD